MKIGLNILWGAFLFHGRASHQGVRVAAVEGIKSLGLSLTDAQAQTTDAARNEKEFWELLVAAVGTDHPATLEAMYTCSGPHNTHLLRASLLWCPGKPGRTWQMGGAARAPRAHRKGAYGMQGPTGGKGLWNSGPIWRFPGTQAPVGHGRDPWGTQGLIGREAHRRAPMRKPQFSGYEISVCVENVSDRSCNVFLTVEGVEPFPTDLNDFRASFPVFLV